MEQEEIDKYCLIFSEQVKRAPVLVQRKVALAYCELIRHLLNTQGLRALKVVRELAEGKVTERRRAIWHKRTQALIKHSKPNPYSVLTWSLHSDNSSYPPGQAASLAGTNVAELGVATYSELSALALETLYRNNCAHNTGLPK